MNLTKSQKKEVCQAMILVMDKYGVNINDLVAVVDEAIFNKLLEPDEAEVAWLKTQKLGKKGRTSEKETRKTS